MKRTSIADIRDLITFSGINVVAKKRGSGAIHLYAETPQDMSNFAGVARVNQIEIGIDSLTGTYGWA
jgi:hypothetical protein